MHDEGVTIPTDCSQSKLWVVRTRYEGADEDVCRPRKKLVGICGAKVIIALVMVSALLLHGSVVLCESNKVSDSMQAIELSAKIMGLSDTIKAEPVAVSRTFMDSTIPYYVDSAGRFSIWSVTYPHVQLNPNRICSQPRDYEILVKPSDGSFLRCSSRKSEPSDSGDTPEYSGKELAELIGTSLVQVEGLSVDMPRLSLNEVLNLATPASAFAAAKTAVYLFEILDGTDPTMTTPISMWCVVTYHIPAFGSRGWNDQCEADSYENSITLIRDDTGELYTVQYFSKEP
jgi:hypothetical protein